MNVEIAAQVKETVRTEIRDKREKTGSIEGGFRFRSRTTGPLLPNAWGLQVSGGYSTYGFRP